MKTKALETLNKWASEYKLEDKYLDGAMLQANIKFIKSNISIDNHLADYILDIELTDPSEEKRKDAKLLVEYFKQEGRRR